MAATSAALPNWLGWLAIVIGVALVTPAFFPAFLVLLAWILVASILVYRRSGDGGSLTPLTQP